MEIKTDSVWKISEFCIVHHNHNHEKKVLLLSFFYNYIKILLQLQSGFIPNL